MEQRIESIKEKKFVGKRMLMSLVHNRTAELWKSFMPARHEIIHAISKDLFSLQIYPSSYFQTFDPATTFEKWALAEVSSFDHLPAEMEPFTLSPGTYAIFLHKGSHRDNSTFEYIFTTWLPSSPYQLDQRPHFEVLGEKYQQGDTTSEEEIWIPILKKD